MPDFEVRMVPMADIGIDQSVQPREALSAEAIQRYADNYTEGVPMPPVELHEIEGVLYMCDGFTRYAGGRKAGIEEINARVYPGSNWGTLIISAIRANTLHGQPLTLKERKASVVRLVRMFHESDMAWSQKLVSEIAGCSQSTVSRIINAEIPEARESEGTRKDMRSRLLEREEQRFKERTARVPEPAEAKVMEAIREAQELGTKLLHGTRQAVEALNKLKRLKSGNEMILPVMPEMMAAKDQLLGGYKRIPHGLCPKCIGKGCEPCDYRGWVTKVQHAVMTKG